jgi:hypothetical protein
MGLRERARVCGHEAAMQEGNGKRTLLITQKSPRNVPPAPLLQFCDVETHPRSIAGPSDSDAALDSVATQMRPRASPLQHDLLNAVSGTRRKRQKRIASWGKLKVILQGHEY